MKGKGWVLIVGGSIALILLAIIGIALFTSLLDREDGGTSVAAVETEAAKSQEIAGSGNAPGQGANQPGNPQG